MSAPLSNPPMSNPSLPSPPLPSKADALSNAVFEEMMWAMSRPGLPRCLPEAGLLPLAQSLIDRECSCHVIGNDDLRKAVATTGARQASIDQADYVFAASLSSPDALSDLKGLRLGSLAYPDKAATLFAPARIGIARDEEHGEGQRLRLTGPGIRDAVTITLGGIDPLFWSLRQQMLRYPLGWDVYLVDGTALVSIPRSTTTEVL